MKDEAICRIPVRATYTLYHDTGEIVLTSADYEDIPADVIARFLLEKFGHEAIFGKDGDAY